MLQLIKRYPLFALLCAGLLTLPGWEQALPAALQISGSLRTVFIFAIIGLGLNVVTGMCGLLNLGSAGFMAIGVYSYAILTSSIYPFQIGFWPGLLAAMLCAAASGLMLGLPAIRLRGDYLAIVTLGFGEIVQDLLRNLDGITKGTQGINPLPYPSLFGYTLSSADHSAWYYLLATVLAATLWISYNLEHSRHGRMWFAIREDELAARSMGIYIVRAKLLAFSCSAAFAGLAGALWASYFSSTGEPGNYDFNLSVLVLCIIIVGGLSSIRGVVLGSIIMVGINSIVLDRLARFLGTSDSSSAAAIFLSPTNWKYMIFGLVLILMMRFRPEGILGPTTQGRR